MFIAKIMTSPNSRAVWVYTAQNEVIAMFPNAEAFKTFTGKTVDEYNADQRSIPARAIAPLSAFLNGKIVQPGDKITSASGRIDTFIRLERGVTGAVLVHCENNIIRIPAFYPGMTVR